VPIVAAEEVTVGRMSKADFEKIIGGDVSQVQESNKIITVLKTVPLLCNMPESSLAQISEAIQTNQFEAGTTIVSEGDSDDRFFIIKEGSVDVSIGGSVVRRIGKSDFFGERSILRNEIRSATVVATTHVVCWSIDYT
jgi:cGMP-dependent protein kinase